MRTNIDILRLQSVKYTTKIAMALGCDIAPRSIFHRKNYFYPDMPKNYQISQYDLPVGERGSLEVEVDGEFFTVGITRAGTPLVEIVSEPDITSPAIARAYATELRAILEYLGVSDVRMEEGSMRVDANISVAPPGKKVEIKNMNSLRSVHRALEYEEKLGLSAYDAGVLKASRWLGDLFEEALAAAKKADAKQVANWVTNDLTGLLAARPADPGEAQVTGANVAELVDMVAEGALSKNQAQQVLAKMLESGRSPREIAEESGIKQVSDESALEEAIDAVLDANPDVVERLKSGDNKPFGFLMGEVMKATKGQGNPKVVSGLIREKLVSG